MSQLFEVTVLTGTQITADFSGASESRVTGGKGWYAQKFENLMYGHRKALCLVIELKGKILISSALVTVLCGDTIMRPRAAHWGTINLFDYKELAEEIATHNNYPRRSERERNVATRNQSITRWLSFLVQQSLKEATP